MMPDIFRFLVELHSWRLSQCEDIGEIVITEWMAKLLAYPDEGNVTMMDGMKIIIVPKTGSDAVDRGIKIMREDAEKPPCPHCRRPM